MTNSILVSAKIEWGQALCGYAKRLTAFCQEFLKKNPNWIIHSGISCFS